MIELGPITGNPDRALPDELAWRITADILTAAADTSDVVHVPAHATDNFGPTRPEQHFRVIRVEHHEGTCELTGEGNPE